jgi:hypothetical protein
MMNMKTILLLFACAIVGIISGVDASSLRGESDNDRRSTRYTNHLSRNRQLVDVERRLSGSMSGSSGKSGSGMSGSGSMSSGSMSSGSMSGSSGKSGSGMSGSGSMSSGSMSSGSMSGSSGKSGGSGGSMSSGSMSSGSMSSGSMSSGSMSSGTMSGSGSKRAAPAALPALASRASLLGFP